jgi:hypothetical protein
MEKYFFLARLRAANHLFLFCTVGMFNIYLSSNTPFSSYRRINFEVVKWQRQVIDVVVEDFVLSVDSLIRRKR